jgi:hypothetical protein
MTCFKNKFFEKRIRWQLHSLINYILYPEFRGSWNLRKVIYSNRFSIISVKLLVICLISSFFIGKAVSSFRIKKLSDNINTKDSVINGLISNSIEKNTKIASLSIELRSRSYLEFKIIKESKIEHIANFRTVPDSIFFLMIDEADKYKIPHVIFFRVMERESKFQFIKNNEGSSAFGYMQVVNSTFSKYYDKLNLKNGHTQGNNIRVAANLISSIHSFWVGKFKNERTVWEYTLAEYGCGRAPMINGDGYIIPESVKPGINYVMKHYGK